MARFKQEEIRRLDLTGPERRLGGAVRALGQIAERFSKNSKRSLPFLARQKSRLIPGGVSLGASLGADPEAEGVAYQVTLEATEANAWAMVRLDTGAVAAILEGSLGARQSEADMELSKIFGKELTVAQRALVGKVAHGLAEDFSAAIRGIVGTEFNGQSGEPMRAGQALDLPKDAICVSCVFEGSPFGANVQLFVGAEVIEAAIQARENMEVVMGDPRMAQAVRGVNVQVIAEMGSLELDLGRVLALQPGEILRMPTAVDEPILLRVAGMEKFKVVPVVSRGQLAVEIRDRVRNET